MKKILLAVMLLVASSANGQTKRYQLVESGKNETGGINYKMVRIAEAHDSTTTITFTDLQGVTSPVYVTKNGKYYIAKVSKKSGRYYRRYIKELNADTPKKDD